MKEAGRRSAGLGLGSGRQERAVLKEGGREQSVGHELLIARERKREQAGCS